MPPNERDSTCVRAAPLSRVQPAPRAPADERGGASAVEGFSPGIHAVGFQISSIFTKVQKSGTGFQSCRVSENDDGAESDQRPNGQSVDSAAPVDWSEQWELDRRVQSAVLSATVESTILDLQSPRAQMEAFLTLKFEVEQRGARNNEVSMQWMKKMMDDIIVTMERTNVRLPPWFVPLSEVEIKAEPFARGSFGAIHRGKWRSGHDVVVKFFSVGDWGLDERAQIKTEKEFDVLFALGHPNVARILGGSHVNVAPYIIFEDTSVGNLGTFLVRSRENKQQMWKYLYEAALGLQYLHTKGIVHGHLKLNNILIGADEKAKLAAFGVNTLRACSSSNDSVSCGLRWRAPECLKGRPTIASDVYSFAMCIIEALMGEPPFAFRDDIDIRGILQSGAKLERPEEVDEEKWELVASMIKHNPKDRVSLKHVTKILKAFVVKDVSNNGGSVCSGCSSTNFAGARYCSNCGVQQHSDAVTRQSEPPPQQQQLLEASTPDLTLDTPIAALVGVIRAGSVAEQEKALVLILRLCFSKTQRKLLYDADGLAVMIDLVKHGRTYVIQVCALGYVRWANVFDAKMDDAEFRALRGFVRSRAFYDDGSSLVNRLRDRNDRDKLSTLVYCSCIAATIRCLEFQTAGVAATLVDILENGDEDQKVWSVNVLGHVACDLAGCDVLASAGAIQPVVSLLQTSDKLLKKRSLWVLNRLARSKTCCTYILAADGIPRLVENIRTGHDSVKAYAAEVLAKLTADSEPCRRAIVNEGAAPLLTKLFRCGTERHRDQAARIFADLAEDEHCAEAAREEVVQEFLYRLQRGTDEQKDEAAGMLVTLTSNVERCRTVASAGAIPPLVALLHHGTADQKFFASCALANLARNVANHDDIAQHGAISLLVSLLQDGSGLLKDCTARALSNLALSRDCRASIVANGTIPLFVQLLQKGTPFQKSQAVRGLSRLASYPDDENRKRIGDAGAVIPLVAILGDGTEQQQEDATDALANLAGDVGVRRSVEAAGAMPLLAEVLQSGTDQAKARAAFALSCLASESQESQVSMRTSGLLPLLESLRRTGRTQLVKRNADIAFLYISQDLKAPSKRTRRSK